MQTVNISAAKKTAFVVYFIFISEMIWFADKLPAELEFYLTALATGLLGMAILIEWVLKKYAK